MADGSVKSAWEKILTLLFPALISSSFFNNGSRFPTNFRLLIPAHKLHLHRVTMVILTAMAVGVTVEATEAMAVLTRIGWATLAGAFEP